MKVEGLSVSVLRSVPEIHFDGHPVRLNSPKAEALLVYMVLARESLYRRDFLAALLWEDRDLKLARDNLRQTLVRIRRVCENITSAVDFQRNALLLETRSVKDDIERLADKITYHPEDLTASDIDFDIDQILTHFTGIGEAFDSWVHVMRQAVENRLSNAFLAVIENSDSNRSAGWLAANAVLKMDPTNETAIRFKMRMLAERGEPAEALRVYNDLFELLDREYDVEPATETLELNAAIKLGTLPGAQLPTAHPETMAETAGPPCIFVPQFTVTNDPAKSRTLADFFRSEILNNLSRFREWSIVDFRPNDHDFYQLDCQIASREDNIEAIVTARQNANGRIVWSEHFIAGHENWRKTQWRIAQQLALAINLGLSTDRLKSCLRERPENRNIFDKWALCHGLNSQWSPDAMNTVITNLEDIVRDTPEFGLAHSHLAEFYNKRHLVYPGLFRSDDSVAKALDHAKRSMALDPLDTHTHRVMAWARALNGDYDVAEFHFQQAFDLNPANLNVRVSCALGFAFLDNLEKACAIADETRQLSVPLQPVHWAYLQNIYFLSDRLAEAKQAGEIADDAILNLPAWQAAALYRLGDVDGANRAKSRFFQLTRRNWHGDPDPSDQSILEWFSHCFPIKNRDRVESLYDFIMT